MKLDKEQTALSVHQLIRKCTKSSIFSYDLANDEWSTYTYVICKIRNGKEISQEFCLLGYNIT
jgi:predicted Ser/Thr protein kinase